MTPLFSIVIPVYNLSPYIASCLQSVQAQTFTDWEAVCVDDGSADDSGEIIRAMAADDPRIRCIRQENAGVSVARNTALAEAKGEYICFLDGDDLLHPQFLALLLEAIDGFDIACSDYCKTSVRDVDCPTYTLPERKALDFAAFYHLKGDLDANMLSKAVWGKLFRRQFALAFSFPAGIRYSEDMHYIGKVLTQHPRIVYIDLPLYGYFERPDSACSAAFSPGQLTCVQTLDDLCAFLRDKNEPYLMGQALRNLYANLLRIRTDSIGTPYKKQAFRVCGRAGRT